MHLTVIGAAGRIGSRVVDESLSRGHSVTAVVRTASREGSRTADVFDPAAVAAAVAGATVVVSAVGHAASLDDGEYYVRAGRSLVEALRSLGADPPRLLVVGGFGSLEREPGVQYADAGGFPEHAAPEIVGQRDALTFLRTVTDVPWTYLSPPPGGIAPGERTGTYRIVPDGAGEPGRGPISMEDFAVAVVDEAVRPAHPFRCVAVLPAAGASATAGPPG